MRDQLLAAAILLCGIVIRSDAGRVHLQVPVSVVQYSDVTPSEAGAAVDGRTDTVWNLTAGQITANFSAEFDSPQTVSGEIMARVVKGSHGSICHSPIYPRLSILPAPSQPKLVLIFRSRRDGRLSWPRHYYNELSKQSAQNHYECTYNVYCD